MLEEMDKETVVSKVSATQLDEEGLRLYREKKLRQALEKLIVAVDLDLSYSETANNAGFIDFKLNEYKKAEAAF